MLGGAKSESTEGGTVSGTMLTGEGGGRVPQVPDSRKDMVEFTSEEVLRKDWKVVEGERDDSRKSEPGGGRPYPDTLLTKEEIPGVV